jgi:hypothetical protein
VLKCAPLREFSLNDSDLRYTFSCPSCAESLTIPLAKIPPVQARFGCPKCGKQMDFPSRDEARVYAMLQGGAATASPEPAGAAPSPKTGSAPAESASVPAEKSYRIELKGFENDVYDRRGMRNLIRTNGLNDADLVRVGDEAPRRAGDVPELKSLFELRKANRAVPPPVCRKHTDQIAYYTCTDTGRPLCEGCATEKKFGGTSVRVCEHCGGTVSEVPVES